MTFRIKDPANPIDEQMNMNNIFLFFFMLSVIASQSIDAKYLSEGNEPVWLSRKSEPIKLYPLNSHYFLFRGKPVTLMTVGEHYSSLVNRNFDYETYFTELQKYGLNQTRIFSGSYVGPSDKGSPLQLEGKHVFIAPWNFSKEKGGPYGNKFDLDKWNTEYFKRLKDVLTSAGKHGVVVEMVLFCSYYEDRDWDASPFNPGNNIQGVGKLDHAHKALTLTNSELTGYQKRLVNKIMKECSDFDNVYFEIANEPYWSHRGGVTPEERGAWHNVMIAEALKAENRLPVNKRHMIAVNDAHQSVDIKGVSVINFHYVATGGFVGGINGVKQFYHSGKALMVDETEFVGTRRVPQYNAADARVEAWEFMVGGGGGYGNLALTSYNVKNPAGKSAHADSLKQEISNLKKFIEGLNLAETFRDTTLLAGGIPDNIHFSSLTSEKQKYVLYFHTGTLIKQPAYTTFPGHFTLAPLLKLPSGKYTASWINPYDLHVLKSEEIDSEKEISQLSSPEFAIDIVLVITK
jgi:hypothetical protein